MKFKRTMANTIAEKLTYLSGTKDAIKQAIIGKGVDVSDTDTFRSYANKIEAIQSGGGGGTGSLVTGTKLAHSTFSTIPDEYISYLETQTDLSNMFSNCSDLVSVPQLDTKSATTMNSMFDGCRSLISVSQLDTSSVTDMKNMFFGCSSLVSVPQLDTKRVTTMNSMFYNCTKLTTVPLLNFFNVTDVSSFVYNTMFYNCRSLTNLGGFTGLKLDLDLHYSPLTTDSVMNIINNAANMTSNPKTLTLHQDVFNKLTQEQIATATAKGWNIAAR